MYCCLISSSTTSGCSVKPKLRYFFFIVSIVSSTSSIVYRTKNHIDVIFVLNIVRRKLMALIIYTAHHSKNYYSNTDLSTKMFIFQNYSDNHKVLLAAAIRRKLSKQSFVVQDQVFLFFPLMCFLMHDNKTTA